MTDDPRGLDARARAERITRLHPPNAGPGYPAHAVRCPDCGQMEWWTVEETVDHGRCRTHYLATTCACDD